MELSEEQVAHIAENVVASLRSSFLVMPRGERFLEFEGFAEAFRTLHRVTDGFLDWTTNALEQAVNYDPRCFVVVRTIVGLTPPELAHITTQTQGSAVDQGQARQIDARARAGQPLMDAGAKIRREATQAMLRAAVELLAEPILYREAEIHRLDKIDTAQGLESLRQVASGGIPYEALLYERLLGRPFASHKDAISELVGDILENEIEKLLKENQIPYHRTGRAERIEGFDQAPDFLIPTPSQPIAVIEAKVTEDDGTARDKITRVQRLAIMGREKGFAAIACIDGRGFRQRRQDMLKLVRETDGLVFTGANLDALVQVLLSKLAD